jgi:hypothetical protein
MAARPGNRYPARADMEKRSIARSEALLDVAVELTFPASDPISIDHAFHAARERETHSPARPQPALRRPQKHRSPER